VIWISDLTLSCASIGLSKVSLREAISTIIHHQLYASIASNVPDFFHSDGMRGTRSLEMSQDKRGGGLGDTKATPPLLLHLRDRG
jgi:hypothetical protein